MSFRLNNRFSFFYLFISLTVTPPHQFIDYVLTFYQFGFVGFLKSHSVFSKNEKVRVAL
ncbi:hypothetical protein MANES_07G030550v8 [Manihot esculenta]|uniref:Uncharacterized protein n=1 Tax=Manihot esculenta TaxID=3983 RepID=A0ACB7HEI4_MANES|nr:hypothetical protein MANES_07G030550v8 [Manihot esculenta]